MGSDSERNCEQEFKDSVDSLDIPSWCPTADPLCLQVVRQARQIYFLKYSNEQINDFISKLEKHLAQGLEQSRPDYFAGEIDGVPYFDNPDSVDLLIHLHEDYKYWGKDIPPNHIEAFLHLVCLSESRKGNFGLAVKAYMISTHTDARKALKDWQRQLHKMNIGKKIYMAQNWRQEIRRCVNRPSRWFLQPVVQAKFKKN